MSWLRGDIDKEEWEDFKINSFPAIFYAQQQQQLVRHLVYIPLEESAMAPLDIFDDLEWCFS